jgi:hypothetical protein
MSDTHAVYGVTVPTPVPVLPSELAGQHVLVLPASADVEVLARAWFPGAAWDVPLTSGTVESPGRGGLLRRRSAESATTRPGLLRISVGADLTGPHPYPRAAAGLLAGDVQLYALSGSTTDQLVVGWLTAAARRVGGQVVPADRSVVIAPDPATAVNLTVWSGLALSADEMVAPVRSGLAGARLGAAQQTGPAGEGPAPSRLTAEFSYDGALVVTAGPRETMPIALADATWGPLGPWAYEVAWRPPDPRELTEQQPSHVHVVARGRVSPVVARVARGIWRRVSGTVVDDAGFVVPADELDARTSTLA